MRWLPQPEQGAESGWFLPSFLRCCRRQLGPRLIPAPRGSENPPPPRVPLSPTAFKPTVCPDKPCQGQRRVRATWTRWDTLGVLGYPFVNSLQSPGRGHACVVPQTFLHSRAVGGREVGHPARRLGGPQEAATEHVPNNRALPHRQPGSLGFFVEHSAFCHVSCPN